MRTASPSRFGAPGLGGAKDSFLTYFFGKDGAMVPGPSMAAHNANIGRHVSQTSESALGLSMRKSEEKALRSPIQSMHSVQSMRAPVDEDFDFMRGGKSSDHVSSGP